MLKAIYANDVGLGEVSVFTFNQATGNFEHEDLFYHFGIVMNDPSWQVYATDGTLTYPIQNMDRVEEDQIHLLLQED